MTIPSTTPTTCSCPKVAYTSEADALAAMRAQAVTGETDNCRVYQCDLCAAWHLTSKPVWGDCPTAAVFENVSEAAYDKAAGCRSSYLKHLRRSPRHLLSYLREPVDTEALTVGSYVHALLFRPVECAKRFHVTPDPAGSDGDVRKQRKLDKEFAKASGLRLITQSDVETAGALVKSVASDDYLSSLLLRQGRPELSLIWVDSEVGLACKCRLDFLIEDDAGLIVVDLKTTRDARMRPFRNDAAKLGYWLQLGFYSLGIAACFPGKSVAFILVAAELESRSARIYEMLEQDVAMGAALARRLMVKYKALQSVPQSEWPGYATQITPLPAPPWAFEEQTDERDAETTD